MRTEGESEDVLAPKQPESTPCKELTWEVDLGRSRPKARWIVVGAAIGAALLALLLFRSFVMAGVAVAAIIGSTLEIFVLQRYGLTSEGAFSRNGPSRTEVAWVNVRRVASDDKGVLLTPLAKPSRLDAFRGVYLRFAGNREEVLAKIAELWQPNDERAVG